MDKGNQAAKKPVPEVPAVTPQAKLKRRDSVSAEVFDPAKAANDPLPVVVKKPKEMEMLTKVTREVLLFRALDAEGVKKVVDALSNVKVKAGKDVIVQGAEEANEFYVIESGNFDVYIKDAQGVKQKVGEYNGQGSFGELALMYHQPRAATVTARTEGSLWVLDRQTFQRVVLGAAFKKREDYMKAFAKVDFFFELKAYEKSNLCDALVPMTFPAKEVILKEGDNADGMYLIVSGEVLVSKIIKGKNVELGKLGPGSYFGEVALVTNTPRAATVIAVSDLKVAFLDVQAFERLVGPCMDILKRNTVRYQKQLIDILARTAESPAAPPPKKK